MGAVGLIVDLNQAEQTVAVGQADVIISQEGEGEP